MQVYYIMKPDQFEDMEIRVFSTPTAMLRELRALADEYVTDDDDITGMCPESACQELMDNDTMPPMTWGPIEVED